MVEATAVVEADMAAGAAEAILYRNFSAAAQVEAEASGSNISRPMARASA
jgi:hypothetical protein